MGYWTYESGWKDYYAWKVGSRELCRLLPEVLPTLWLKRRQAELILEYLEIVAGIINRSHQQWSPEQMQRTNEIDAAIRQLNRKGKEAEK